LDSIEKRRNSLLKSVHFDLNQLTVSKEFIMFGTNYTKNINSNRGGGTYRLDRLEPDPNLTYIGLASLKL
jgi:hypothetical protein